MTRVVAIAGTVVMVDQITKVIARSLLAPMVPVTVIDGLVAFTLVWNRGLAFGLLAGLPTEWRWVVAFLSLIALGILARVALRLVPAGGWPDVLAIGLIFGGAVGNLIDRAWFGAVIDFIDVYWRAYHWPAFNAADSAITIGVALLALRLLIPRSTTSPPRP